MFVEPDVIEFINRIVNAEGEKKEVRTNIIKFRDYLVLTKMTDNETIKKVDKVIQCLDSLLSIKAAIGVVDVETIINAPNTERGKSLKKVPITQARYADKHYNHYESSSSSSCGTSSSSCYTCGASSSRRRC